MNAPTLKPAHLDHLWFQVSGTLCNLTCHHCFISCSPKNDSFGFLAFDEVQRRLEESVALGVKEYYFTGGEPFLNPDMVRILVETLKYGPATVLTNGTVFKDKWLHELRQARNESRYSLELRVSIDGCSAETNDPIRGEGTFVRAMRGVKQLVQHGFLPIITVARTWPEDEELQVVKDFINTLKGAGYDRPRLKILPTLQMGAEENRTHGYLDEQRVTEELMAKVDPDQFVCHHSRIVTDRGIHVCPILIESPDSLLAESLEDSLVPYSLSHGACFTCYQYGAICTNPSAVAEVFELPE